MAEWDYHDEGARAPKHLGAVRLPRQRAAEPVRSADVSLAEVLEPPVSEAPRPAAHRGRRRVLRKYVPRHAAPPN